MWVCDSWGCYSTHYYNYYTTTYPVGIYYGVFAVWCILVVGLMVVLCLGVSSAYKERKIVYYAPVAGDGRVVDPGTGNHQHRAHDYDSSSSIVNETQKHSATLPNT